MGVSLDGSWIWFLKNDTINSKDFAVFLIILSKLTKPKSEVEEKVLAVLLVNAKIHKSSLIWKVASNAEVKMLFLPPYSPEIAVKSLIKRMLPQRSQTSLKKKELKKLWKL